ncbi:MAG: response regulator, partial [Oscillospiraceae bacterium]|nr:response regulator [Oscillospiraceae bacterium]
MYRLIIADDEQNTLDGISNLFPWNEIGFHVAAKFCDGASMLDYLRENPVDVVLSDIEMPGMSGIELCRQIQGDNHECRMVLFSGYQNYDYFRTALTYKVFDYILKPVRFEDLKNCFLRLRDELDTEHHVTGTVVKGYYEQVVDLVDQYILAN